MGVGDFDNHVLQQMFETIFSTQMLINIISLDPYKSTHENFDSVTLLLKCLDKVARANQELLMKPYTQLVQYAFPLMVHLFSKVAQESIEGSNQE